jgi:hypothetical protein
VAGSEQAGSKPHWGDPAGSAILDNRITFCVQRKKRV